MPALASPMEDILDASRVSFLGYFERKPRGMHLVIAGRAVRVLFQGYLERFGLAHGTQLWSCQRLHCATVPDITLWLCRARLHSARLPAYRLLSVSEAIDCCTGTLSVECVVRVAAVQPPFCGAVTHWVTGSLLVGCLSGNSCTRAAACCGYHSNKQLRSCSARELWSLLVVQQEQPAQTSSLPTMWC